jgi:hypothetical protein
MMEPHQGGTRREADAEGGVMGAAPLPWNWNQDPGTQLYHFRRIAAADISENEVPTAKRALAFLANDLDISAPSVQWFVRDAWNQRILNDGYGHFVYPIDLNGLTPAPFKGEILIRGDLDSAALIRAVAHELRHVRQEIDHGSEWRRSEFDLAEQEAREYESEATPRYPEYIALIEPTNPFSLELRAALELPEAPPQTE